MSNRLSELPDTNNPSPPIQLYPVPLPLFQRIALAIGFWEPFAMTDVTRAPMCMVNMGGFTIPIGQIGMGKGTKGANENPGGMYHVHWYKYPLISWPKILTTIGCMQGGEYDIGYLSELDPMWMDDNLALFTHPEALLFGNSIAQLACAADAIASEASLPLDALFWCAGSHGSMYPFTWTIYSESSGINSALLLTECMNFKLHRQGMIWDTIGENKAVCQEYPPVIMPKSRYRYQLVNRLPDANQCHPTSRTVIRWQTGKEMICQDIAGNHSVFADWTASHGCGVGNETNKVFNHASDEDQSVYKLRQRIKGAHDVAGQHRDLWQSGRVIDIARARSK